MTKCNAKCPIDPTLRCERKKGHKGEHRAMDGYEIAWQIPPARCACTYEAGDSPCSLHGMEEERQPPASPLPASPHIVNLSRRSSTGSAGR